MDDETLNQLKEQFETLPEEVQQAIVDTNLPDKLQQVVKKNQLMIDQAGILETETDLVLYGIEPLENYTANLARQLQLPKDKALAIAHDVDDLIFKNIRDSLKKINEEVIAAENEAAKTPGTPSKEETLAGIENPGQIKMNEQSVSMSNLTSNNPKPLMPVTKVNGVEIRPSILPEINPEAVLPIKESVPYHENVSPVPNIVEAKMTETVAVPKETIIVEEKTKLPEKEMPKPSVDAYREPIN